MSKTRLPAFILLCALALVLGACTPEAEDKGSQKAGSYSISGADARLIAEKFPGVKESANGLRTIILAPGIGTATPKYGSVVSVSYEARFLDGTLIETSAKSSGGPIVLQVGLGRMIKAWDETLMEMKKGEKRRIIVPHWLGYGVTGAPPKIPPYATLVFDLELVEIK